MFQASIYFLHRKDAKDKDKYEIIFNVIDKFKKQFDFTIHFITENERKIYISFNGAYSLTFDLKRDKYYVEIDYRNSNINDFKDKYEYLHRLIKEEF